MRRILKKERKEKKNGLDKSGYLFPYSGFIDSRFAFKANFFLMMFNFFKLVFVMQWFSVKYIFQVLV